MRVLVVTPWFPSEGHPSAGIFNLRDAELISKDHQVRVVHLIRPDWYINSIRHSTGIEIIQVPFALNKPRSWNKAVKVLRAEISAAQLLHTMAFPALLPISVLRVRVPWVHTEHWSGVGPAARGISGTIGRILKPILKKPDEVVAVSRWLAKNLQNVTRRRPTVISNAVQAPLTELVSRDHNFGEAIKAVAVGGLISGKGPIEAVEAVAILRGRGINVSLRWVGTGALLKAVMKRAKELGVSEHIELSGELERESVHRVLSESSLFLLPTSGETFGVAIAEALMHGLPVVVSGEGGHSEFLPRFASRIVHERTGASLADAVQELASDPRLWSTEEIATYAREIFSEDKRRNQYRTVYSRAVRSSRIKRTSGRRH